MCLVQKKTVRKRSSDSPRTAGKTNVLCHRQPPRRRGRCLSQMASQYVVDPEHFLLHSGAHFSFFLSFLPAAYFTQSAIDNLYTVDDFPEVGRAAVPPGMFASARVGNRTAKRRSAEKARRESADAVSGMSPAGGASVSPPIVIAPASSSAAADPTRRRAGSSASLSSIATGGARSPRTHPYYYPMTAQRPTALSSSPTLRAHSASPTPSAGSSSAAAAAATVPAGAWDREAPPQLAPLAYLESLRSPPRDPIDDYALQSFSMRA
jgi:hypothetical protein